MPTSRTNQSARSSRSANVRPDPGRWESALAAYRDTVAFEQAMDADASEDLWEEWEERMIAATCFLLETSAETTAGIAEKLKVIIEMAYPEKLSSKHGFDFTISALLGSPYDKVGQGLALAYQDALRLSGDDSGIAKITIETFDPHIWLQVARSNEVLFASVNGAFDIRPAPLSGRKAAKFVKGLNALEAWQREAVVEAVFRLERMAARAG
jgi:hypothetical protein